MARAHLAFKEGGNNETTKSRQRKRSKGLCSGSFSPPAWSIVVLSAAAVPDSWPSYHPDRVALCFAELGRLGTQQLSWSLRHE